MAKSKKKIISKKPFQIKKYRIIYADPAWRYDFCPSRSRATENHYPTMPLEDIKNLKIPCDDNCILYLWATAPKLEEAMEVMRSWGFKYRTGLVWDKEIIGMGRWFRNQHEHLLVGLKGEMKTPSPFQRISSVYRERRTKHSKKPDFIRNKIAEWYPNIPKLEMFARVKTSGWDIWGNECPNDVEIGARK